MGQCCPIKMPGNCAGKCSDRLKSRYSDNQTEINCPIAETKTLVRCIVVGNDFFDGKIKGKINEKGQVIDHNSTSCGKIHPPKSIEIRAVQLMTELNLTYGVFDFMVVDNGDWFFDALNPIGQYQWVEDIKGNDISSSIAKWLMMSN